MNRSTTRILPVFFLLLVSCEEYQVRNELVGVWTYDLQATRNEMLRRDASPSEINYMESIMTTLAQSQVHFKKGGELTFSFDDLEQEGEWSLQESGREIVMNLTGTEQVSTIEYLANDTLILAPKQEQNGGFPRVLITRSQ